MIRRRSLVGAAGGLGAAGLLGTWPGGIEASGEDYRALVVVYLNGGNDGHNTLVPTDGLYVDYQAARQNLALPRSSLVALPGRTAGHTFGLHPALAPMAGNVTTTSRGAPSARAP